MRNVLKYCLLKQKRLIFMFIILIIGCDGLCFDQRDNSIIVSGRSQSAITKIDYESGRIKWILGDHKYWKPEFQNYLLTPVHSSGDSLDISDMDFWPSGQHSPRLRPDGNLLVYDNGDYREFYPGTTAKQAYSRLVEYSIDEQTKEIQLVREFNFNKEIYTKYTGSVGYQPDQRTTLIGFMYTSDVLLNAKIVEVGDQNNIIFEADLSPDMANYRALKLTYTRM
jgi:arylsulfate sulfotransferase